MLRIFEGDGYRFFFDSDEHWPIHVHVRCAGGEAVFDVDPFVELREPVELKVGSCRTRRNLHGSIKCLLSKGRMNTLVYTARSAYLGDGAIAITMRGGAFVRFHVTASPRLAGGTPAQLDNIEISPFGLHWPDLDKDLSFAGIAQGDRGQNARL